MLEHWGQDQKKRVDSELETTYEEMVVKLECEGGVHSKRVKKVLPKQEAAGIVCGDRSKGVSLVAGVHIQFDTDWSVPTPTNTMLPFLLLGAVGLLAGYSVVRESVDIQFSEEMAVNTFLNHPGVQTTLIDLSSNAKRLVSDVGHLMEGAI
ncbi:hypothetical protein BYT27DRAFT_7248873 [Phlegmacium glaucopus]|nr:hypothetical protein BYT27DRAFT_7248873 [Phlegmacium glaucopus]